MTISRRITLAAAAFATAFATSHAEAATLALVSPSTKVCQLTGEIDWETGLPTAAKTLSNFGLISVDLGFPVDTGFGPLYFMFGDANPPHHPPMTPPTVPPDDAIGWTDRKVPPDPAHCLDMKLFQKTLMVFADPTLVPPVQQGSFNVPSGGVFFDKSFEAFFWTNHCLFPGVLAPDPATPLELPAPTAVCFQIPLNNSLGSSMPGRSVFPLDPVKFDQTHPMAPVPYETPQVSGMPNGFNYVSGTVPRNPAGDIPIFGAARYRASIPYLAMAPRATFEDQATWSFLAKRGASPVWITRAQWESGHTAAGWSPPPEAEIFTGERCIGEHQVTWNEALKTWIILYNCGTRIDARTAPDPWGPWSDPITLIAPEPSLYCKIINTAAGCTGKFNYWPGMAGFFYAPFALTRYTEELPPPGPGVRVARIYWLVSTWNPYQVSVMQSTLRF